jgi:hypothetical protein
MYEWMAKNNFEVKLIEILASPSCVLSGTAAVACLSALDIILRVESPSAVVVVTVKKK